MDGACRVYNPDALRDLIYSNLEEAERDAARDQQQSQHESMSQLQGNGNGHESAQSLGRTGASRLDGGPSIRSNRSNRSSRASLGGGSQSNLASSSRAQREQARTKLKARRFRELQSVREKQDRLAKKERMHEIAKRKEKKFKYWMARVNDPKEREVVDKVHDWLDLNDDEAKRKLRALHQDWEENVYGAISNDILTQMESRDSNKTKARIRREYQNYIDLTNKKGQIFRDIFVESEYDPNVLNRATIKATPKTFDDPTDRVLRRRKEEIAMMSGGWIVKDDNEGGRETLEVESWLTGKIESTPHGFAARFGQKPPEVSEMQKRLSRSRVKMNQFHILTGEAGRAKLMEELGPGKKPVAGKRPDHKIF
mgnify:FL=1|jgi:hypothetical protein